MSHRPAPVAALALVVLTLLTSACWIEDGFDGSRSNWNKGESHLTAQNVASIHPVASASTTVSSPDVVGTPYTDGRRVYVRTLVGLDIPNGERGQTVVQAFDARDLHLLWTAPTIFGPDMSITIAGDRLLVPSDQPGDEHAIVYELDAATGGTLAQDDLGAGGFAGAVAYDGATAAVVVRAEGQVPFLWWGNLGNATGHTFTNVTVVFALQATSPAFAGRLIIVGADDRAFAWDKSPADAPGTTCTGQLPCPQKWISPKLGVTIPELEHPVVLDPHRVLISNDLFHAPKPVLDIDTGALVWTANYLSTDFNAIPAATDAALFTQDQTGRVFVHASTDCTAPGTPPTCLPTKVMVPSPLGNGFVIGQTPVVAGRLVYAQTEFGIDVFDVDCATSGTDPVSHLPACSPRTTMPIRYGDGNQIVVSEGSVYVTSKAGLQRWTVDS